MATTAYPTPGQVAAARSWLADCVWADMDPEDDTIDAATVVGAVEQTYCGGWAAFTADHGDGATTCHLAGRLGAATEWLCDALDVERGKVKRLTADVEGCHLANSRLFADRVALLHEVDELRRELREATS